MQTEPDSSLLMRFQTTAIAGLVDKELGSDPYSHRDDLRRSCSPQYYTIDHIFAKASVC